MRESYDYGEICTREPCTPKYCTLAKERKERQQQQRDGHCDLESIHERIECPTGTGDIRSEFKLWIVSLQFATSGVEATEVLLLAPKGLECKP